MKPQLEDQIDKMGPRMEHISERFIRLKYLVAFSSEEEVPAAKPTLRVKRYIMVTNPAVSFDIK